MTQAQLVYAVAEQMLLDSSVQQEFGLFGDDDFPLLTRFCRKEIDPLDRATYIHVFVHKYVAVHALVAVSSLRATRTLMRATNDASVSGIIEMQR